MEEEIYINKKLYPFSSFYSGDAEACLSSDFSSSMYTSEAHCTNENLKNVKTEMAHNNSANNYYAQDYKCSFFSFLNFYKKKDSEKSQQKNGEEAINDAGKQVIDLYSTKLKNPKMYSTAEQDDVILLNKKHKNVFIFWWVLIIAAYIISLTSLIGFLYVGRKLSDLSIFRVEKSEKLTSFNSKHLPLPILLFNPIERFHKISSVLLQLNESERMFFHVSLVNQNIKKNEIIILFQTPYYLHLNQNEATFYDKDKNIIKKWNKIENWQNKVNVVFNEKEKFFKEIEKDEKNSFGQRNNVMNSNSTQDVFHSSSPDNVLYSFESSTLEEEIVNNKTNIKDSDMKSSDEFDNETKTDVVEPLLNGFPVDDKIDHKVFYDGDRDKILDYLYDNLNDSQKKDFNKFIATNIHKENNNTFLKSTVIDDVVDINRNPRDNLNKQGRRLFSFSDIFNFKSLFLNGMIAKAVRAADSVASAGASVVQPTVNYALSNPFSSLMSNYHLSRVYNPLAVPQSFSMPQASLFSPMYSGGLPNQLFYSRENWNHF